MQWQHLASYKPHKQEQKEEHEFNKSLSNLACLMIQMSVDVQCVSFSVHTCK